MIEAKQRLLTLDAMRGVAALIVVLYHLPVVSSFIPKTGHLAVDFFFMLSGFVLARNYDARLVQQLTFGQFATMRYIRLYPLFAVGLTLALVQRIWQLRQGRMDSLSAYEIAVSLLFELFLLPSPVTNDIFPLNGPSWSLFFELAVNLLYASVLTKLRLRSLVALVAISGISLVCAAIFEGKLNAGFRWNTIHIGALRTIFAFSVGIVIARVHNAVAKQSWLAVAPLAVLALLMCMRPRWLPQLAYELMVVIIAAPTLVWVGASFNPMPVLSHLSEVLGDLSYSVYAIHLPLLLMFAFAADMAGINQRIWLPICILTVLILAWALHHHFDTPIRSKLTAAYSGPS